MNGDLTDTQTQSVSIHPSTGRIYPEKARQNKEKKY